MKIMDHILGMLTEEKISLLKILILDKFKMTGLILVDQWDLLSLYILAKRNNYFRKSHLQLKKNRKRSI